MSKTKSKRPLPQTFKSPATNVEQKEKPAVKVVEGDAKVEPETKPKTEIEAEPASKTQHAALLKPPRGMKICKVDDAVDSCCNALSDIQHELEQWAENMPENMQGSWRYDQATEAASTVEDSAAKLENLKDLPDVEVALPTFISGSKPARLSRIADILERIANALPQGSNHETLEEVVVEIQNVEL